MTLFLFNIIRYNSVGLQEHLKLSESAHNLYIFALIDENNLIDKI